MKLVDIDTKITALLWDDEHEQETEREMTVGEFLDEFTAEGLLEIPLYVMGAPHGRLIDADALISRCKDEKGSYYGHESAIIGEAVESAPTVIEAED